MKIDRITLVRMALAVLLALTAGCTATPTAPPSILASRLTPSWIASARRVHSADRTVYYRGQAEETAGSNPRDWHGTIHGEILALNPNVAVIIPTGTLALRPGGVVKITGPHTATTSDAPSWRHLLIP